MVIKTLFTRLGFCYVAVILFVAQSGVITAIHAVKCCQGEESRLAGQDQRGYGNCERLPGPPGSAEVARSINCLWSPGKITTETVAGLIQGGELDTLAPNCVLIWTTAGCGFCNKMPPVIEQLKNEGYTVYVFEYARHRNTASQLGVTQFPTSIIFESHKEVKRIVGATSAEEIKKYLKHDQPDTPNIW